MDKGELYSILNSEFWRELQERLNAEVAQAVSDLISKDLTKQSGQAEAMQLQERIAAFRLVDQIIQDFKEEATEETKEEANGQ